MKNKIWATLICICIAFGGFSTLQISTYAEAQNIALGKPLTASYAFPDWSCAENLTDGNASTFAFLANSYEACSGNTYDSLSGWIKIDLQGLYSIDKFEYLMREGASEQGFVEIRISETNIPVNNMEIVAEAAYHQISAELQEFTIAPAKNARYIALRAKYYNVPIVCAEFRAFGEIAPENIALGKSLTASYAFPVWSCAENLTDGNASTFAFLANSYEACGGNTDDSLSGWIKIDLQGLYSIDKFEYLMREGASEQGNVEIRTSEADIPVNDMEVVGEAVYHQISAELQKFPLTTPKYARYVALKGKYYNDPVVCAEFRIFGDLVLDPRIQNIDIGKTTTSAYAFPAWSNAANLNDGNASTFAFLESSESRYGQDNTNTGWIKIDLQKIYDISKFEYLYRAAGSGGDILPGVVEIRASELDIPVNDMEMVAETKSAHVFGELEEFPLETVKSARYVALRAKYYNVIIDCAEFRVLANTNNVFNKFLLDGTMTSGESISAVAEFNVTTPLNPVLVIALYEKTTNVLKDTDICSVKTIKDSVAEYKATISNLPNDINNYYVKAFLLTSLVKLEPITRSLDSRVN